MWIQEELRENCTESRMTNSNFEPSHSSQQQWATLPTVKSAGPSTVHDVASMEDSWLEEGHDQLQDTFRGVQVKCDPNNDVLPYYSGWLSQEKQSQSPPDQNKIELLDVNPKIEMEEDPMEIYSSGSGSVMTNFMATFPTVESEGPSMVYNANGVFDVDEFLENCGDELKTILSGMTDTDTN
jgi:hypothetical protein